MSFTLGARATAGCAFADSQWVPALSRAASLPPNVTLPHGLFRFGTNNCGNGAVLNFTVTLPAAVPPGTPYYKFGKTAADNTPHWYTLPAVLNGAGTQYTFSITDGGLGACGRGAIDGVEERGLRGEWWLADSGVFTLKLRDDQSIYPSSAQLHLRTSSCYGGGLGTQIRAV